MVLPCQVTEVQIMCSFCDIMPLTRQPENIMLRSTRGNAFIKLIDFGCSEVLHPEEDLSRLPPRTLSHQEGATTAYCPPEAFSEKTVPLHPSADMWALGGE